MLDSFIRSSSAQQLCSCDLDVAPPLEVGAVDLAFIPRNSQFWLGRPPQALAHKALEFLAHRVSNNHKDLLAHLQRVAANFYAGTPETLYGAMLDLFIVLDNKGLELRRRLFMRCAPLLGKEQRLALSKGLESGLKAGDRVPLTPASLLKLPNRGSLFLVERLEGHVVSKNFDPLDEARDLIDSGFIDEARMMLEELLSTRPDCEETNKELLDLYKYTKNREAFFAARQRLAGLPLALSENWEELAEKFMTTEERVGNE